MSTASDILDGSGEYLGPLVLTFRGSRFLGRRLYRSQFIQSQPYDQLPANINNYDLGDKAFWASVVYGLDFGESAGELSAGNIDGYELIYNSDDYASGDFDAVGFRNDEGQYIFSVEGSTRFTDWLLNIFGKVLGISSSFNVQANEAWAAAGAMYSTYQSEGGTGSVLFTGQSLGTLGAILAAIYFKDQNPNIDIQVSLISEPGYRQEVRQYLIDELGMSASQADQLINDVRADTDGFIFESDTVRPTGTPDPNGDDTDYDKMFVPKNKLTVGPTVIYEKVTYNNGVPISSLVADGVGAHSSGLITDFLRNSGSYGGGTLFIDKFGRGHYFASGVSADIDYITPDLEGSSVGELENYGLFMQATAPAGYRVTQGSTLGDGTVILDFADTADPTRRLQFRYKHNTQTGSVIRIVDDFSGALKIYDGDVLLENDSVAAQAIASEIAGNPFQYSGLMATIGSQLGAYIGGDNPLASIATSSFLGAVAMTLGESLDVAVGGGATGAQLTADAVEVTAGNVTSTFINQLKNAAIGSVSSFLAIELGEALGLEGFGAELFTTTSSSVFSVIFNNVINDYSALMSFDKVFAGLQPGAAFGNIAQVNAHGGVSWQPGFLASAIGSFIGSKLGNMIVAPTTQAGVVLSSLGSAVGTYMFGFGAASSGAIGTFAAGLASSLGQIGNFVVPGLGALIGSVLGALIGNLFGSKDPKIPTADAETELNFNTGYYELGSVNSHDGGSVDLVRNMAVTARDSLNEIIAQVTYGSAVAGNANTTSPSQFYGHTSNQIWAKRGSLNASQINYDSAADAVDDTAMWALKQTKIVGGDLLLKRAIYQTTSTSISSIGGDLKVAEEYGHYLQNKSFIDAMIAEPYRQMSASDKNFFNANRARFTRIMLKDSVALNGADQNWYNTNKTRVDQMISGFGVTQFAAGWVITLQRAAELGLDKTAHSDFYGGFGGFADSLKILMANDLPDLTEDQMVIRRNGNNLRVVHDGVYGGDNAGSLYRLYMGGLDREPDPIGFSGGFQALETGMALVDAANGIINSSEFYSKYGNLNNEQFVNRIYINILNRNAEPNTVWLQGLNAGTMTRADVLIYISSSAEALGKVPNYGNFLNWMNGGSETPYELFALDNFFQDGGFNDLPYTSVTVTNATGRDYVRDQYGNGTSVYTEFTGASPNALPTSFGNDFYSYTGSANRVIDDLHTEYWTAHVIEYDGSGTRGGGNAYTDYHNVNIEGGDDVFITGSGSDTLYGRRGYDWLDAGAGSDTLYGGNDDDVLLGREGNDVLYGENGNDSLFGGAGNDSLSGSNGDDKLHDGVGRDNLAGHNNDDIFYLTDDGEKDSIHGGAGSDTVSYRYFQNAVSLTLAERGTVGTVSIHSNWQTSYASVAVGNDNYLTNLYDIENIEGSNYDDDLRGNTEANHLIGGAGDDILIGYNGNDILEGGLGGDILDGGAGGDIATYENSYAAVWVDLTSFEAFGGEAEGDVIRAYSSGISKIYHLIGSDYADTLKGNGQSNNLTGGKGDDWFIATVGSDRYYGDEDFDTVDYSDFTSAVAVNLNGSSGWAAAGNIVYDMEHAVGSDFNDSFTGRANKDDYFTGGKGNDTMAGSTGNDTYIYNKGDGNDTINESQQYGGGFDVLVMAEGLRWNDFRYSTNAAGTMTISFAGSAGDSITVINQFQDNNWTEAAIDGLDVGGVGTLNIADMTWGSIGSNSANTVRGGNNKRDFIQGLAGNDSIYSWHSGASTESNNNYIIGGRGNDTIRAGTGDDQYVFELGDGADTIFDSGGDDSILFGPQIAADDIIFKVSGSSLFIGVRDYSNPTLEAHQVADRIHVRNAVSGNMLAYGAIEYITAGGVDIDIRKTDIGLGGTYGGGAFLPPIAIDLGNDGLDLISVNDSRVVFQSDSGGPMYRVGWLGASDGWLSLDRNGNGVIDSKSEISFIQDLEGAQTDLEGLRAFDSNGDGLFDAGDEMWSSFTIWRDLNTNGFGGKGELMSLADAGIDSISLDLAPTGDTTENVGESVVLNQSAVTFSDGSTTTANDVAMYTRLAHVQSLVFGTDRPEWGEMDFSADGSFGLAVTDTDSELSEKILAELGMYDLSPEDAASLLPEQTFSFLQDNADLLSAWNGPSDNPDDPITNTFGVTPIVLDMDGNGFDLINPGQSSLELDVDSDGDLDRIGWVSASDALLGLDRNGNGLIELNSEISFLDDTQGANTDLEGLAAFDTDGSGWLDAGDEQFTQFRVWRDADFDAVSSSDELMTLSEAGISGISLSSFENSGIDDGYLANLVQGQTAIRWSDGSIGIAGDVELRAYSGDAAEDALDEALRRAAAIAESGQWDFDPSRRRQAMRENANSLDVGGADQADGAAALGQGKPADTQSANDLRFQSKSDTPTGYGVDIGALEGRNGLRSQAGSSAFENGDVLGLMSVGEIDDSGSEDRKVDRWWLFNNTGNSVGYGTSASALSLGDLMDELDAARRNFGKNANSISSQRVTPAEDLEILADRQRLMQAMASFHGSSGASTLKKPGADTLVEDQKRLVASSVFVTAGQSLM